MRQSDQFNIPQETIQSLGQLLGKMQTSASGFILASRADDEAGIARAKAEAKELAQEADKLVSDRELVALLFVSVLSTFRDDGVEDLTAITGEQFANRFYLIDNLSPAELAAARASGPLPMHVN